MVSAKVEFVRRVAETLFSSVALFRLANPASLTIVPQVGFKLPLFELFPSRDGRRRGALPSSSSAAHLIGNMRLGQRFTANLQRICAPLRRMVVVANAPFDVYAKG